ncbi:DsrH/TusB family sulfur metabolism protein [Idiomarina xiamenensis]|uniref:Sulfur relay protein TusB/DsrH n=1 Tax=Idiomarina xiamenensis 10-D-4 TaxID=740709 RepID=K2KQR4_9GAMM|nr:DsrH/TusB family sulfur metabolism protein [Idiomarina xiamenensis]EKE79850.1 hypothetical protein A10D4_12627 [Idiomarina xiamenensis 10-D-4]
MATLHYLRDKRLNHWLQEHAELLQHDDVLLLGESALLHHADAMAVQQPVYALQHEVEALGLQLQHLSDIRLLSDAQWVELTLNHTPLTW